MGNGALGKGYAKCAKVITNKHVRLFSNGNLVLAAGYFTLKKTMGISATGWLLNNLFKQALVDWFVYITISIFVLAILAKLLIMVVEYFPPKTHAQVGPDEISACLSVMNREIYTHLQKCEEGEPTDVRKLREQHSFDVNMRLVTDSLAEHVTTAITSTSKVKKKDLFISVYKYEEELNTLRYVLHFHPRRDLIKSRTINIDDPSYSDYECIKCMKSQDSTTYTFDARAYAIGHSKRCRTVKHSMGVKLERDGKLFGFMTLEFHNNKVFSDESSMQDFMEENVFPFKLLLEYQYLKHEFFGKFENFEDYWRVA